MTMRNHVGWAIALLLLAVAALWVGWIGFIASDDSLYYVGASQWLTAPPSAGADHWSTRFPLTLTFAAFLALLGRGFAAFAATALLFYALLVATMAWYAAKVGGSRIGWLAALLTATLPVVVTHATTVSVDLLEATALLLGAGLLAGTTDDAAGRRRALLAGTLFGVAILCRETSVLPLAGLAVPFLLGRPVSRQNLILCAVGTVAVLAGEAAYQYALTGEPLRRYAIAFHHDEHIDRAANMEGNLLLWPPLDPLLVLLVNDDFGLLFWLAGAGVASGVLARVSRSGRRYLVVLAAMAGASFLLVALLYTKLVLNPRYFLLPALLAVIVLAVWLDRLARLPRLALLALVIGSNLLLLGVGNAHPRWAMEALVAAAAAHPGEAIAGDPVDVRRARLPMTFLGQRNLRYAPAAPGALTIAPAEKAPPGQVIARYPSPPTRVGAALQVLHLDPLVPHPLARRMFAPNPEMALVRTAR